MTELDEHFQLVSDVRFIALSFFIVPYRIINRCQASLAVYSTQKNTKQEKIDRVAELTKYIPKGKL